MITGKEIVNISVDNIVPNRFQPRLTFDEAALNELANSIKEHGIIQPLVLRQLGDKYEIIAGERRYKASTLIGLKEVPAIIVNVDDKKSSELAVVENIQRKELTSLEEANSYKRLLDLGQMTQEELALKMGKTQPTIANKLRLLNLSPEVQNALLQNEISERHARSLLQVKDLEQQKAILNKIKTERMTVKDTDDYIKSVVGPLPQEQVSTSNQVIENNNVVNLNALNDNNFNVPNENISQALDNLAINNVDSNTFNDKEIIIEDRKENEIMNNNQNNSVPTPTPIIETPQPEEKRFFPSLEDQMVNMNTNPIPPVVSQPASIEVPPVVPQPTTVEVPPVVPPAVAEMVTPTITAPPIVETPPIINQPVETVIIDTPQPTPTAPQQIVNQTITPPVMTQQTNPSRLSLAINKTRSIIQSLEAEGFVVETQEADLEKEYQIIIKIAK